MSDIMSMLAPGGAAAGGPPPDALAALLGGGGGAPAPADAGAPPLHGAQGAGDSDSAIREAIDALQAAAQAETEEADIKVILTCITNLQGILAKNEAGADSMMSGKASPRDMRKAAGAAGYGG
jgi:hypothetical protein